MIEFEHTAGRPRRTGKPIARLVVVQASRNVTCEVYGARHLSGDPTYANTPIHIFRPGSGWTWKTYATLAA